MTENLCEGASTKIQSFQGELEGFTISVGV